MKPEELEKIRRTHDYCLIPTRFIICVERDDDGFPPMFIVKLKPDTVGVGNQNLMQFVDSDYFQTLDWGKL